MPKCVTRGAAAKCCDLADLHLNFDNTPPMFKKRTRPASVRDKAAEPEPEAEASATPSEVGPDEDERWVWLRLRLRLGQSSL